MFSLSSFPGRMIRFFFKWFFYSCGFLILTVSAILIFFSWQANTRESLTVFEAAPDTGRHVRADDIQVFIQEDGPESGPVVLLVHGTGAWSEIWRETMSMLAQNGFHVIAIDVPPFGYSEKPYGPHQYSRDQQAKRIIGMLDTLDVQQVTLVGHSVGSRPVIEAALKAPDKITNLILVDPALGFTGESNEFQQNQPAWLINAFFNLETLRNALLATFATNPFFTQKIFSSFVSNKDAVTYTRVKMLQQPYMTENITQAYGDWLHYLVISRDYSLTSDFENFKKLIMPVFIIWGSTDTVTPLWQGERLKDLVPNSRLSVIDNVGHIPYIEDTKRFNAVLLDYLKETVPMADLSVP